jgi:RNA polymerase sigma-70 factor, ECF subfamily
MGLRSDYSSSEESLNRGTSDRLSDNELVRIVLKGWGEYFACLVRRYERVLYHLGMRFYGNGEDAGDFVQDVFLRAYEHLGQFRGTGKRGKAAFYSWLIKIAYSLGIREKKMKNAAPLSLSGLGRETEVFQSNVDMPELDTPEEERLKKEMVREVKYAIEELPKEQSFCIDAYFFLGLSYKEISEVVELPLNTVRSHIRRAKQGMRKVLKGTTAEAMYSGEEL